MATATQSIEISASMRRVAKIGRDMAMLEDIRADSLNHNYSSKNLTGLRLIKSFETIEDVLVREAVKKLKSDESEYGKRVVEAMPAIVKNEHKKFLNDYFNGLISADLTMLGLMKEGSGGQLLLTEFGRRVGRMLAVEEKLRTE